MSPPLQIILTPDQSAALQRLFAFMAEPNERVFVLSGNSGCGKSSLVKYFLEQFAAHEKTMKLIDPTYTPYVVALTATTNKAAENLAALTGQVTTTIHSHLGLRVERSLATGATQLVPTNRGRQYGQVILIDEASFIDSELMDLIFKQVTNCKIIFIGDPCQIAPIKSTKTPVFSSGFPEVSLTKVVRQAEHNPIIDLSMKLRDTVNTGEWFQFKPDGYHIQHLDRDGFALELQKEFNRPDWHHNDSKVLAFRNTQVLNFNKYIREFVSGAPDLQEGDYAIVNSALIGTTRSYKVGQTVLLSQVKGSTDQYGVKGRVIVVNGIDQLFLPDSLAEWNQVVAKFRKQKNLSPVVTIERTWIDLRAAYAQTVDKAQGSTYDKVFIDLDDISHCTSGARIARMLYVAVSRARHQVIFTGDLV